MAKDVLPQMTIKYRGTFDFDALFKMLHDWFKHRKYDLYEGKYKHKIDTKGAEQEIGWMAERKITHYFKYKFNIDFKFWELKDIDVEGKKMQYGRVRIYITPTVFFDYGERFEKTPFLKKLHDFFINVVYLDDFAVFHWDKLYYIGYDLHQEIKDTLEMTS